MKAVVKTDENGEKRLHLEAETAEERSFLAQAPRLMPTMRATKNGVLVSILYEIDGYEFEEEET